MSKIYAKVKNESNGTKMIGSDKFLLIKLSREGKRYASIGWVKETNEIFIYGCDGSHITTIKPSHLGYPQLGG